MPIWYLDDFIEGDDRPDAGECHLRTGNRVDGGHDVALDAGDLDQSGDGVAHQPEDTFQRKGRSAFDRLLIFGGETEGCGCHGAGGTVFGLTAVL